MDETDVITPFAIKMSDAGYFDLTSLPLNAADTWLVTGDNGDVGTDALEQDFDGKRTILPLVWTRFDGPQCHYLTIWVCLGLINLDA